MNWNSQREAISKPGRVGRHVALAGLLAVVLLSIGCDRDQPLGPVADAREALAIRQAIGGDEGADGGGPAKEVDLGSGWATLRGRFEFDGTPPTMPPYNANKDLATCAPGGTAPPQETLVVDSGTMGIKNIAVYLRDAPRVHESAESAADPAVFDQKMCVFLSHVLPVQVGQTIELKNSDNVGHNTNISGRNSFNQTIPAGETIPFVAQREEAVPAKVVCSIHPWMVAWLLPRETGYASVTADDGSFEIANLPAGVELEIQVWHESATGPGGGLILSSAEAEQLNWSNKGRFTITLEQDETREIELVVPATAFRG